MKQTQLALATAALPVDFLMLTAAGLLAYALRFAGFVADVRPIIFKLTVGEFFPSLLLAALVGVILFALSGLYSLRVQFKLSQEIGRIFLGCTAGLAVVIVLFFFNPALFSSRFIVLVGWITAFILVSAGRIALRLLRWRLRRAGNASSYVVLIGADPTADELAKLFETSPELGYRVVQRVAPAAWSPDMVLPPGTDELMVADPTVPRDLSLAVYEYCSTHHLGFRYVTDTLTAKSHNIVTHTLAGVPMIEILRTPLEGWGSIAKRIFDLVTSVLLIILLIPLWFVIGVGILADSGWPIFVGLTRVGEHGGPFTLYKFRSMVRNAHLMKAGLVQFNERNDGPLFKISADPRITQLGKYLRKWSLDELPQLWNVLKGNMSLVGPRPHEPGEVANYQVRYRRLLNLKPGITGLAQVSGRSNLTFAEEARLDMFYVENWSLGQDLVILIKTFIVVLQRESAV